MKDVKLIRNVRLLEPGVGIIGTALHIQGGKVVAIDPPVAEEESGQIDGAGRLLTPGLIDLHIHGLRGRLFEDGPNELSQVLKELPRFGVTCVAPTIYRKLEKNRLPQLKELARALSNRVRGTAEVPGFHLEGPFLKLPGAGAHTYSGDPDLMKTFLDTLEDQVAAVSISPDTENILPVIKLLREREIPVFITHTQASVEETEAAIEAGARHATHFYDVFPLPEEKDGGVRPCGAVETIMADPRVTVDFIGDGVHVHPMAIKMALTAKGSSGVALISDANLGAGLPDGRYETSWGYAIRNSSRDAARIEDPGSERHGMLAGSSLTMDAGVNNLLDFLNIPEPEIWALATKTPAAILGLPHKGSIQPGSDADFVIWDADETGYRVHQTWINGTLAYSAM